MSPAISASPPTVNDIAATIAAGVRRVRVLVAVDGGDGSGKTTFAAELARALEDRGHIALIIHVDDFMHVRAVRHRRGRTSPEAYLDDSYDYEALTRWVLEPLSMGGSGRYRAACVDRTRDIRVTSPAEYADPRVVTIVEGLFLLRDELAHWWDYSVFLDVPTRVAMARKSRRDAIALDPDSPLTERYVQGQQAYRERHRPMSRATWVLSRDDANGPVSTNDFG